MKIAFVHNFYREKGGEDAVVESEIALLRGLGHEVVTFFRRSDEELGKSNLVKKLQTGLQLTYRKDSANQFQAFLMQEKPNVVHVHNTFPLLSPSVLETSHWLGVPTVLTFHNFRFICANGLFLREGKACEKCLKGSPAWGAYYGCYRGSTVQTLPLTRLIYRMDKGRRLDTWVNKFIVLSEFSRRKFLEAGVPANKIVVKPNFSADPGPPPPWIQRADFALFVGRLSEEKGVRPLIEATHGLKIPLTVAGDGPMRNWAQANSDPRTKFLGNQSSTQIRNLMRRAKILLIPSLCYENFPLVIAEAWSNGLPVAASQIGSLECIVNRSGAGILFPPDSAGALASSVNEIFDKESRLREMGPVARSLYEKNFSPSANAVILKEIYEAAMSR